MSIKKATLASLILLSLTACSSGGGSGGSVDNTAKQANKPNVQQLSEQDKAKQQAEKTRLENELNTVNKKLANAENNVVDLQNSKKIVESELEKTKQLLENAQKEKVSLTNELTLLQTKFDSENKEKTQLQNQLSNANNKLGVAQNALEKLQQDKQASENQLAQAQENVKLAQAEKATAEEKLAGKQRVIDAIHTQILKLNQRYYNVGLENRDYQDGFNKYSYIHISPADDDGILLAESYVYKLPYFTLNATKTHTSSLGDDVYSGRFRVDHIDGQLTENTLNEGTATYTGIAFNADNLGRLNYQVNFADKTGSGILTGFDKLPDVELKSGRIENAMIRSEAMLQDGTAGKYQLGFYGPNAESIAGEAYIYKPIDNAVKANGRTAQKYGDPNRGTHFGFGGERGEIAK